MHVLDRKQALEFVRERRGLFDAAGEQNPFACSAWVLHFLEHIAGDDWTILAPERDADSLLMLYRDGTAPWRLNALTNYYASLYSPLVSVAPDRAAAATELAGQLAALRPRPAIVNFAPIDGGTPEAAALRETLGAAGWYVRPYFCFGNWYLPCEGLGFDAYMAARDSRLYNTWTRKAKKFRSGADGARLEIVTDPAATPAAMAAYERVYAKSWKVPEPWPGFVRGWAQRCAENGWLRLGLAWLGDVPIAAQFWFTMNGRALIFKLAYDEDYSKLSAGTVLSAHLFRHALEVDRVVEIDYLTGDDDYKKSWMTHRRERIGLLACNPATPRGLLRAATEFAGALSQRWRNRERPAAAGG